MRVIMMPRSKGERMQLVSVHIPKKMLEELDRLVMRGMYPSRNEAIRIAIRDLLSREGSVKVIVNSNSGKSNNTFARVVCENGHVIAFMRAGTPTLMERIKALQIAGLVCPTCHSAKLFIELM